MQWHDLAGGESVITHGHQGAKLWLYGTDVDKLGKNDVHDDANGNAERRHLTERQQLVPPLKLDAFEARQLMKAGPEEAHAVPEHEDVFFD